MSSVIKIKSGDGFEFSAYEAFPDTKRQEIKGNLIILQEIFGVNDYIRYIVDTFAKEGYRTIAPALFDRKKPGIEYSFEQAPLARETMSQLSQGKAMEDIGSTIDYLNHPQDSLNHPQDSLNHPQDASTQSKGVAVLGFCWGGLLSFLAGNQFETICNIAYYGGRTQDYLNKLPKSPTQFHFGDQDTHISLEQVGRIQAALPNAEFHIYSCGHGFDNHTRASYSEESSIQARKRSIDFLNKHFC